MAQHRRSLTALALLCAVISCTAAAAALVTGATAPSQISPETSAGPAALAPLSSAADSIARGFGPGSYSPLNCAMSTRGETETCLAPVAASDATSVVGSGSEVMPSARWGAAMVYDAAAGYVLLFSGSGNAGPYYGETWAFHAGVWSDLTPPNCASQVFNASNNRTCPFDRTYPAIAYVPQPWGSSVGYVLMFGGQFRSDKDLLNDTWVFAGGAWTNVTSRALAASGARGSGNYPPPLHYASMTYDARDGYAVLFGGCTVWSCLKGQFTNETFSFSGGVWKNLTPAPGSPNPPPLYANSLAFFGAPSWGFVVLFGGDFRDVRLVNFTWMYAGGVWTNITPGAGMADPPTAYYFGMASNATSIVEIGGTLNIVKADDVVGNYTWAFDGLVRGVALWKNLTMRIAPPPRLGDSLAFDAADGYFVMFGGLSGTLVGMSALDDTWTLTGTHWSPVDFSLTFVANGLPTGSTWKVTIAGHSSSASSSASILFELPNDTYAYLVGSPAGYAPTPSSEGTVTVAGAATHVTLEFEAAFSASFKESGLPSHCDWYVDVSGVAYPSTSNTIEIPLADGTYAYTFGSEPGYRTPAGGNVTISEDNPVIDVKYTVIKYAVTFSEQGLAKGTSWNVTIGRTTVASTSSSVKFQLANGTYNYSIAEVTGYSTPATGSITIAGVAVTIKVVYTPSS